MILLYHVYFLNYGLKIYLLSVFENKMSSFWAKTLFFIPLRITLAGHNNNNDNIYCVLSYIVFTVSYMLLKILPKLCFNLAYKISLDQPLDDMKT